MGKYSITTIDIYELEGQSNAGGQGDVSDDLPAAYQGAQSGVNIYYKTTLTSADDGSWQSLTPGTNNHGDPAVAGNDFFGVEAKLYKDLKDNNSKNPYCIKNTRGGTSIADWLNTGTYGPVSDNYYCKVSLSKIVASGFPKFKCCAMLQGYSDCTSLANANGYGPQLLTWATERNAFYASVFKSQVEYNLVVAESPDYIDGATNPAWVDIVQAFQLAFATSAIRKRYSIAKPSVVTFNGGPTGIHWDGDSLIRYSDLIYAVVKDF